MPGAGSRARDFASIRIIAAAKSPRGAFYLATTSYLSLIALRAARGTDSCDIDRRRRARRDLGLPFANNPGASRGDEEATTRTADDGRKSARMSLRSI